MGKKTAREWALLIANEFGVNQDYVEGYILYPKDGDEFAYCTGFSAWVENSRYSMEKIDYKHGDENNAEHWFVYKFTDKLLSETVYVKFDGIYDSWADTYWMEPKFVVPVERYVTFYEDVE